MTQFVQEDIILKHIRQTHYIEIQVDIVLCRTAPPVGGIVLYGHPLKCESITCSQRCKPRRKFRLSPPAQPIYLLRRNGLHILLTLTLPCDRIQHPLSFRLQEEYAHCIRHPVRHRKGDTLYRMHPYAYSTASRTLFQEHFADLRIIINLFQSAYFTRPSFFMRASGSGS